MNDEKQFRWLLPDGVNEGLPPAADRLEALRRRTLDEFYRWGYDLVDPPMLEYLESLTTGTGEDLGLQVFKVVDQHSGRQLGIRADITPQVARIDAHRLRHDGPTRLCYAGPALHARSGQNGESREPLLAGAELFGSDNPQADAEVATLMVHSLHKAGIEGIHLDLGHVGVLRAIVGSDVLDDEVRNRIHDALSRKSLPDIRLIGKELDLPVSLMERLEVLLSARGPISALSGFRDDFHAVGNGVEEALDNLEQVAALIVAACPGLSVGFDLAEMRGYTFHTGVLFSAFVRGQGREIARGGRYDDVGLAFGRARPATGFSMDLRELLLHGGLDQNIREASVLAPAVSQDELLEQAIEDLRRQGVRVIRDLPGAISPAHAHRRLVFSDVENAWIVAD